MNAPVEQVSETHHVHGPILSTDPVRIEQGQYFHYIHCFNGCGLEETE